MSNDINFEVNDNQYNLSFTEEEGCSVSLEVADVQYVPGPRGPYFTPTVSSEGIISWTNNGGLPNPQSQNIRGPQGEKGEKGEDGQVYVHIVDNTEHGQTITISTTY